MWNCFVIQRKPEHPIRLSIRPQPQINNCYSTSYFFNGHAHHCMLNLSGNVWFMERTDRTVCRQPRCVQLQCFSLIQYEHVVEIIQSLSSSTVIKKPDEIGDVTWARKPKGHGCCCCRCRWSNEAGHDGASPRTGTGACRCRPDTFKSSQPTPLS